MALERQLPEACECGQASFTPFATRNTICSCDGCKLIYDYDAVEGRWKKTGTRLGTIQSGQPTGPNVPKGWGR